MKTLLISALTLIHLSVFATPSAWVPSGGGDWNSDGNWTSSSFPNGKTADAIFSNRPFPGAVTINLNEDITVNSLLINLTHASSTSFTIAAPPQELRFQGQTKNAPTHFIVANPAGIPLTIASDMHFEDTPVEMFIQEGATLTIAGQVRSSGASRIDKRGKGTLLFQGTQPNGIGGLVIYEGDVNLDNTPGQHAIQTGNANIEGGTLRLLNGAQTHGGFNLTINSGTFDMNGFDQTCQGIFYNGGTIIQSGGILSNFSEPINMRNTILEGPIRLVSGGIHFDATNGGTALVNGTVDLNGGNPPFNIEKGNAINEMTVNGVISNGSLTKTGLGTLNLAGVNTYAGPTTVNEGTLKVNGTIVSTTTVNSGAQLIGIGSTTDVINNGTVNPGETNAIGTLNVGAYTQNAGGNLTIQMDDFGASDLLNLAGAATISGTLTPEPQPGIYPVGTRFRFINYPGIPLPFNLNDTTLLGFSVQYNALFAELINSSAGVILPVRLRDLHGNAAAVGNYLFCEGFFPDNQDFFDVLRALVKVPADQFAEDLVKLSPFQFGALPLVNLQSHRLVGDAFAENTEKYFWCDPCAAKPQEKEACEAQRSKTSVWVTPIGNYYHQDGINNKPSQPWADKQIPFNAYSVGVGLGADHLFFNSLLVGGGAGYTYSNIDWEKHRGDGHWNSVYLGPYVGWLKNQGFVNFLVLGSYNLYHIDRNIQYPGVNRTASNTHHSYDLLLRLDGGYKFRINTGKQYGVFYILPEARISYFNIFEEGYTESGAGSLNLQVDSQYTAYLQPSVLVKFLKDISFPKVCVTPAFQVGWIANVPLTSNNYTSRLYKQNTCQSSFSVKSFHDTSNQMTLGGEIVFRTNSDWIFEIGYKADIYDNQSTQSGKLKLEKRF